MKYLSLFLMLFSATFYAQNAKILDATTKEPLPEVTIYNQSKTKFIVSDENGIANLASFSANEIITFSHVSYIDYEIKKKYLKEDKYIIYLQDDAENLEEISISVFKRKEKTNRIAEQVAVLPIAKIERLAPQTSADLLANIAGIKVQKSQFGGGSPVLRGMESNRVLLVVDGVRMNNAIYRKGHLQNAITVNPNLLERVEVVFGPTSVTYGSDALGGVIHYYTKEPKIAPKNEVKGGMFTKYSSVNNEVTNSISAELRTPSWASITNLSYSDFGDLKMGKNRSHGFDDWGKVFNYSENTEDVYAKLPVANSDVNLQKNTGYSQFDLLQKIYVPLSKKTDFKLNIQYSRSSNIPRFDKLTELKKGKLKFAEWHYGPQERLLVSPQFHINIDEKWLEKAVITLAYQNVKESRIQRKFNSLKRTYRNEEVDVFSINADFFVPIAQKSTLTYGFDVAYNDVASESEGKKLKVEDNKKLGFSKNFIVQSRYPDGGSSYLSASTYADYKQNIGESSTLNTGVRLTHTNLEAKWINETFIKLPNNDINLENTALTATASYVFKPNTDWQLNGVLSSGFRSPNIDDVGKVREKNNRVTVPNINLKPEYAYNAEVGLQKYFNNQRFRMGVNAYYTLLQNYIYRDAFILNGKKTIDYDGETAKIISNVNKGKAYVAGFTTSYQGKLHKNWQTSGSITYTQGKTYDTNQPMSSIPPLFGKFDLSYSRNKIEAGLDFVFNARKKIEDYNLEEGIDNHKQTPVVNAKAKKDIDKYYGTPSWKTFGVNAKYSITDNIALQMQVNNLFDEHYKEFASGVSAPGRNFVFMLSANF